MKRPTERDFEASDRSGVQITKSSVTDYRLADSHDVATVGTVSMDPTVRHGTAGGLGDYSAHWHEVYFAFIRRFWQNTGKQVMDGVAELYEGLAANAGE
jgi:hypothetical protein